MVRGSATQFKFKMPYLYDELEWITIKFWQTNNPNTSLPITKYKSNCSEPASYEICVSLSASETARFSDKYKAKVQLRTKPFAGEPFGSREHLVTVYPMRDDIMEEDPMLPPTPTDEEWIILDGHTIVD